MRAKSPLIQVRHEAVEFREQMTCGIWMLGTYDVPEGLALSCEEKIARGSPVTNRPGPGRSSR